MTRGLIFRGVALDPRDDLEVAWSEGVHIQIAEKANSVSGFGGQAVLSRALITAVDTVEDVPKGPCNWWRPRHLWRARR